MTSTGDDPVPGGAPEPAPRPRRSSTTRPTRPGSRGARTRPAASAPRTPGSRHVDKARTRRALLDGALELLTDRSLDNLGIREVTRAAGVAPAAFYRHF